MALPFGVSPRSSVSVPQTETWTPRPAPRCCQSHEKTGSSARALSSPPPGILSYDLSIAAVAAASARTAALLGAGPEQTASAVEEAVESFFRTIRKQEPKPNPSRTLYFDLYQDDEEGDHDDDEVLTCEPADPSAASDQTTPTGTSRPSGHASYGGSSAGGEGMLRTPLAFMANSQLSPHSGGSAPRAYSAGPHISSPWCGDRETPAESTAGNAPPAPAWAASSSGFNVDGPPHDLQQAALQQASSSGPLGLPPRPRSRPPGQNYGKLPRSRGVRASQMLDGALNSAFTL